MGNPVPHIALYFTKKQARMELVNLYKGEKAVPPNSVLEFSQFTRPKYLPKTETKPKLGIGLLLLALKLIGLDKERYSRDILLFEGYEKSLAEVLHACLGKTFSNETYDPKEEKDRYHPGKDKHFSKWILNLINYQHINFKKHANNSIELYKFQIHGNKEFHTFFSIHLFCNNECITSPTPEDLKQIFLDIVDQANQVQAKKDGLEDDEVEYLRRIKDETNESYWDGENILSEILDQINNLSASSNKTSITTEKNPRNSKKNSQQNYPVSLQNWHKNLRKNPYWSSVKVLADKPIDLRDIYTNIRLSQIKEDSSRRGVSALKTVLNRIHKKNKIIHLYGASGSGKTTLAKWITGYTFIENEYPTILILLSRYLNKIEQNPLLSLLEFFIDDCCHPTKYSNNSQQELEQFFLNHKESILILDGWDKMSHKQQIHVTEQLNVPPLSHLSRIVISRPTRHNGQGTENIVRSYKIQPLTIRQAKEFLSETLSLPADDIARLQSDFSTIKYFTPFFLVIFNYLFSHPDLRSRKYKNFADMLTVAVEEMHPTDEKHSVSAVKEMEKIANILSFQEDKKQVYFSTKNTHIINSRLVTRRSSISASYPSKNYFFLHPIIQSYFTATSLVENPDNLESKLNSHGLRPDREEGWILISGLLFNDSRLVESNQIFWKFWKQQVKQPGLLKSVICLVAHLLKQQRVTDGGMKLLGVDLIALLWEQILSEINIESNIKAFIALSDKIDLIYNLEFLPKRIRKQVHSILQELEDEKPPEKLSEIEKLIENGDEKDHIKALDELINLSQIEENQNENNARIKLILSSFKKISYRKRFSKAPPVLLKEILTPSSTPRLLLNCLKAMENYSIETDAYNLALLYKKQTSQKIKNSIARIVSNCRSKEAQELILSELLEKPISNTKTLKIMSKGTLICGQNIAKIILQAVIQSDYKNKSFPYLMKLLSQCFHTLPSEPEQLNFVWYVDSNIKKIIKIGNKGLTESLVSSFSNLGRTSHSFKSTLQEFIDPKNQDSLWGTEDDKLSQKVRVQACSLLTLCYDKNSSIAFLNELLVTKPSNLKFFRTVIRVLIELSPLSVVRYYYNTKCNTCYEELLKWSEIENIRIYPDRIYRANGEITNILNETKCPQFKHQVEVDLKA